MKQIQQSASIKQRRDHRACNNSNTSIQHCRTAKMRAAAVTTPAAARTAGRRPVCSWSCAGGSRSSWSWVFNNGSGAPAAALVCELCTTRHQTAPRFLFFALWRLSRMPLKSSKTQALVSNHLFFFAGANLFSSRLKQ